MWTCGEEGVCDLGVGGAHVELETIGWLGDHLECALQDADGKPVCWLCCQPQPEVLQIMTPSISLNYKV